MRVRYKDSDGKRCECECRDHSCPKRGCFAPGYFQHRGCLGSGGGSKSSGYNEYLSCLNRDYHGCADSMSWYDAKEGEKKS